MLTFMHIQIVHFNLQNLSEADYVKACETMFAEAFRDVDGLLSKVWLSSPETNTYGGVYTWQDKQAMEAFQKTELFGAVATNPQFANLTSKDFGILEGPTQVTRGLLQDTLVA
jgi:AAA+ ATPase superfamily predicted ATPase